MKSLKFSELPRFLERKFRHWLERILGRERTVPPAVEISRWSWDRVTAE